MIGPLGHELFPERRRRTPVAVRERPRRCPVSIGCDARIGSDWDATSTAAASSRVGALELQLESEIVFGQSAAVQTLQTLQTALIVVIFGHISPLPVRCCSCHRPKQSRRAVLGSGAVSVPVALSSKTATNGRNPVPTLVPLPRLRFNFCAWSSCAPLPSQFGSVSLMPLWTAGKTRDWQSELLVSVPKLEVDLDHDNFKFPAGQTRG